jgi:hypothetical protein
MRLSVILALGIFLSPIAINSVSASFALVVCAVLHFRGNDIVGSQSHNHRTQARDMVEFPRLVCCNRSVFLEVFQYLSALCVLHCFHSFSVTPQIRATMSFVPLGHSWSPKQFNAVLGGYF